MFYLSCWSVDYHTVNIRPTGSSQVFMTLKATGCDVWRQVVLQSLFFPCLVRYKFSSIVSNAAPSSSFHCHTHLSTCPLVHVFKVHVWKAHSLTCTHTLLQNHSSHSSASQDFSKEQRSFANQINTTREVWEQYKALCASICLFTFAQKDWGETVRSDLLLLFILITSHYGK